MAHEAERSRESMGIQGGGSGKLHFDDFHVVATRTISGDWTGTLQGCWKQLSLRGEMCENFDLQLISCGFFMNFPSFGALVMSK